MSASPLDQVLTALGVNATQPHGRYVIPQKWNTLGYHGPELGLAGPGEITVHPARFYLHTLSRMFEHHSRQPADAPRSLSRMQQKVPAGDERGGDWLSRAVIYTVLVRHMCAWDHDHSSALEVENRHGQRDTGTFLKLLALLPWLQQFGVDTIALLPVSRHSRAYAKGELGSPYAVADSLAIEPDLADPLLGELPVEIQFAAFCEAAHRLGMRILIDVIPRTSARASTLLSSHPEWFYWLPLQALADYRSPPVASLGPTLTPIPALIGHAYASDPVREHMARFCEAPAITDPQRWQSFIRAHRDDPAESLLAAIEETFSCTVAPAFSDHINDVQAPWSDVTFLRLYQDHPLAAREHLPNTLLENLAPYICFDSIKADYYPGEQPQSELWEYLMGVIPAWQQRFGINGARIDMGHALPQALLAGILARARAVDPDFAFLAEELYPERAGHARAAGYNAMAGNAVIDQPRPQTFQMHAWYYNAPHKPCAMLAGGETHDTPRLAGRPGGRVLARLVSCLNYLVPGAAVHLNAGQELGERQPLNLGIDCQPEDQWQLPAADPNHGKLALFDACCLHWHASHAAPLQDDLRQLAALRQRFPDCFSHGHCFVPLGLESMRTPAMAWLCQSEEVPGDCLLVVASTDLSEDRRLFVQGLPDRADLFLQTLFEHEQRYQADLYLDAERRLWLDLAAGEVRVFLLCDEEADDAGAQH